MPGTTLTATVTLTETAKSHLTRHSPSTGPSLTTNDPQEPGDGPATTDASLEPDDEPAASNKPQVLIK